MQLSKNQKETELNQTVGKLGMVGLTGLEPVTPRLSSVCSNQLSYRPALSGLACHDLKRLPHVEVTGFEPMTSCLQSRRSTN